MRPISPWLYAIQRFRVSLSVAARSAARASPSGFWAIGSPNYTDATASVNDVLHLNGGTLIAGSLARCRRA